MSPLYDIACTNIYQFSKRYETAIPLNNKKAKIRPSDFKEIVKLCKIDYRAFTKEAKQMLDIYIEIFPKYIDLIKKHFPDEKIYKIKVKPQMENQTFKATQNSNSLGDTFENYFKQRVESLQKYGWMEL